MIFLVFRNSSAEKHYFGLLVSGEKVVGSDVHCHKFHDLASAHWLGVNGNPEE
jgi:hypothetical protein